MKARNLSIWHSNQWVRGIDQQPFQLQISYGHFVLQGVKNPTYFPLNISREVLYFYWSHCWLSPVKRDKNSIITHKNINTFLTNGTLKKKAELQMIFLSLCCSAHAADIPTCDCSHDKLHNFHTSPFHMHIPFLLSFFLFTAFSLPQTSPYTHGTVHPHTHYPSQPSPCAHIYIHTNTEMDQFHIPFQDAEEVVSHCQFMAQCLIPPNAAMQISYCYSFSFRAPSFSLRLDAF